MDIAVSQIQLVLLRANSQLLDHPSNQKASPQNQTAMCSDSNSDSDSDSNNDSDNDSDSESDSKA